MKTSESTVKIDVAIAKAQRNVKKAMKDSENPHFRSKYADLESVSDACMDAFTAEGIAIIQAPSADGQKVTVTTRLSKEGEYYESDLTVVAAQAGPQQIVACITYGRRAGLAAMTGVCPADDDGEAAEGRETKTEKRDRPPAPTQTNDQARENIRAATAVLTEAQPTPTLDPVAAYKATALKEAITLLGDQQKAIKFLCDVRGDQRASRPWDLKDCEKVKMALAERSNAAHPSANGANGHA